MKNLTIALALVAAGCSSSKRSAAPVVAETRVSDLQTSMTELLERIDVLNARMARLEESQASPRSFATTSGSSPAASSPPMPAGEGSMSAAVREPRVTTAPAATRRDGVDANPPQRAVIGAQMAEQYRNAIVLYGRNRMAEARKAFQQVYDSEPNGDLADNALFWIGETYFAMNDWTSAQRFYRRVGDDYGDQNKAPDAVLKLAMTYEKTGDLGLARKTLQEVIRRYPYSTPAATAKSELNRIKY